MKTTYEPVIDPQGRYELRCGSWSMLNRKISDKGHSIVLKRPHSTSYQIYDSYQKAVQAIRDHCEDYEKLVSIDNELGKYLSSNDGKWGK
tara:strand:+ start:848 stop:1117 length:270 start_codon:yes stop_codon:yes gene_type:complete